MKYLQAWTDYFFETVQFLFTMPFGGFMGLLLICCILAQERHVKVATQPLSKSAHRAFIFLSSLALPGQPPLALTQGKSLAQVVYTQKGKPRLAPLGLLVPKACTPVILRFLPPSML